MPSVVTLFARQSELAELGEVASTHKVVTICGPAGVGKSTLLQAWLPDEVAFVDLTDYRGEVGIETYIAAALGLSLSADADETARRRALRSVLDAHQNTLVLDNAEHIAATIAELVSHELFADCRFVVATRNRLRCGDEHLLQLDPFATEGDEPEALAYLRWRASTLGSAYALRDDEDGAVRDLVRRLDGLPLAMDLAAGRLNLLRPAMLLQRLEDSRDVLSGEHSRSLNDALLTSWEATELVEQRALAALSVLDAPFDPTLGEALIGEGGLDILQRLRDRSVIVVERDGRIRLLLSVRDFVRQHAAADAHQATIDRLLDALAARAPTWLDAATRLSPIETVSKLRQHASHLRLAVTHGTPSDARVAVCATALAESSLLDGTSAQAFELFQPLLARNDTEQLRVAAARLAIDLGRLDDADELLESETSFEALLERAQCAQFRGDLDLASQLVDRATPLAASDQQHGRAATSRAGITYHRGHYDEAREHYERALRHARRSEDRRTEARVLQNLGVVHCDRMRLDLARRLLNEAVALHQEAGDVLRAAWGYNAIGVVELRASDPERGIAALQRAAELFDRVGHRAGAASARANLAMIAVDTGRWDDGVQHSLDALERASAEEDPHVVGMCRLFLALCTWLRGDRDGAGRHFVDFEATIERDAHIQLAISWDAALGAYLAATGAPAEEVFQRGEQRLSETEGHEVYRTMFELARCQSLLRELRLAQRDRSEVLLELFNRVTGVDMSRSEPLRYTVALLEHEATAEIRGALRTLADADAHTLLVSTHAEAIRPPGGAWTLLGSSPSLWRLFLALAESARDAGGPVDFDALQAATWPGEVLTVESATNRLHVSLSKLRGAGLKPFLVRDDDGYQLDCPVVFV